ncbi:MAG TPA: anaerobic ribonucleoside-triphosphate reductase activating protein [Casimicrobiaceae bacterium]|nr:anaerobic ribonucleoside-triphosphate reductase activating protein [Casimicrobiaceae bacterium]
MDAAVHGGAVDRAPFRVGGVVPFSTTDWPGRLAAVVFAQGCPWRCGYCHNPHLIPAEGPDEREWEAVRAWLETRKGLLEAVVFSGGEPTAQPGLRDALSAVRDLGFRTGLHTGGIYPRKLPALLPHLDWVGLDIKAPRAHYGRVTGVDGSGLGAFVALALLQQAGVAHEVRTTVHLGLTPPELLETLATELAVAGVHDWVLQPFRPQGCLDATLSAAAPHGTTLDDALLARLRERVPGVVVRA